MLFTVSATFSDFTAAYEQYEVDGPVEALVAFMLNAGSLSAYGLESRATAARTDSHRLIHVAGEKRGLWVWHLTIPLEHEEIALYGGCIVQTDSTGPVRSGTVA
jgi:hypothetical protein